VCLCVVLTEKPPKCKRAIVQPREGFTIENVVAQTVTPIPYDIVKEGVQT
jgi:large subunit ribosomal protein L21e